MSKKHCKLALRHRCLQNCLEMWDGLLCRHILVLPHHSARTRPHDRQRATGRCADTVHLCSRPSGRKQGQQHTSLRSNSKHQYLQNSLNSCENGLRAAAVLAGHVDSCMRSSAAAGRGMSVERSVAQGVLCGSSYRHTLERGRQGGWHHAN